MPPVASQPTPGVAKDAPLIGNCPRPTCRRVSWFGQLCPWCDREAIRVRPPLKD